MYWIDNNTGIATAPDVPAVTSATKRFFTNGGSGVPPSVPEDFWFHMIQEELLGVLTMAGIAPAKGDLNQIAKAIQSIAFSAYPVGAPIPWPTAVPPSGFLAMIGQSFSAATYPKLAIAYPALVLPDMRAEFIRGWDASRGIDSGRTLLSSQSDAIRNIVGNLLDAYGGVNLAGTGALAGTMGTTTVKVSSSGISDLYRTVSGLFDASRVVPTAADNRPRNISFNYIVRAA